MLKPAEDHAGKAKRPWPHPDEHGNVSSHHIGASRNTAQLEAPVGE
jgi:hypothetical protein